MVIRITVEAIVYSLLYTAFMLVLFRIQGAKYQLYNYPPAIKARAIEKGITTQAELDAHAKKNRVFGLFVSVSMEIASYVFFTRKFSLTF